MLFSSSWVEISKEAIVNNINQYKSVINPGVLLAPVIKSNAYGHGIELIAAILQEHAAVNYICVVSLREAVILRRNGIKKPILVLSIIDDALEQIINNNIDIVAYDADLVRKLNIVALQSKQKINIHVKVDTGLSRAGILYPQAIEQVTAFNQLPGIVIKGIFTHFANSESDNHIFAQLQINRFLDVIHQLESNNIVIPLKHMSCTAALTHLHQSHFNFARFGIGLYGLWPSSANKKITEQQFPQFQLRSALTWKTRVAQIKKIPTGSFVGYDITHQTKRDTVVGILPVGYWDGYDRNFSNNGVVLIDDKQAQVLGRIAMNLTMIDLTDHNGVKIGDEALLLADKSGITAEDLAHRAETINYEIVTRINPLLPRIQI